MLSKGHPYFDPYGKPERMIGVSMDSTERKILSENLESKVDLRTAELLKANKELRAVNEQLEQFAFISSHDLQEPLRKIQTFSNLLSTPEAHLNNYAQKYTDKISASALRMSTLLRDLLSFSILINTDKEKFTKVDLNHILENVVKDFELVIEKADAEVNIGLLPTIMAEPVKMNQLFHNLVSNALKFGREKLSINITSSEVTSADFDEYPELKKEIHYVVVRIQDNGVGFEQKYAHKIFTLFQRLRDKIGVEGTGIGLAICKKILEDHGGLIFVRAEVNVGATFILYFPAKIEEAETDQAA
ncbi:MAG: PAS domain-containing sensor histidine kinase [Marivirga sp.]|nr:PAS domain-containing sensor histidine kinase [Marivirga sp.]